MSRLNDDKITIIADLLRQRAGNESLVEALEELQTWRKFGETFGRGAFSLGSKVEKTGKSEWSGTVVGFYRTEITPFGYAIESQYHKNSVQIYPETVLKDTF